ncbi:hypothetical protein N7508_007474 [Penicillium antarcticum]|uniref:uncharacterized protein n=1 Tax=Penicillium antarcticum TaxID=416450 RepID=UPI00238F1A95|nr:uncharacterized protein N7508_007474 [Penicillium antarcticum]KAJ5300231.1 hypothetical protein N7508_007474 [Penicillium antarcticum]
MPKEKHVPWTESEEDNLEPWLSIYDWMPWKERAKEYSKQHDKDRSFESLRGKRNQLRKGIRRRRPISDRSNLRARTTARRALYRIQRLPQGFPPRPPNFRLKSPDPWARQLLQQVHQYGNPRHQVSAPASQNEEGSQPAIAPNNATPVYISPKPVFRRREQPMFISQLWRMIRRMHISHRDEEP